MVKENFFDDLVFYDKENISDDVFDMLTKIVKFDTFDPVFVGRSSKAASSLCSWILAVYEYAKVARSQRTKLEQLKAYQELYNKVNSSIFCSSRRASVYVWFLASTNSR